MKEIVLSQKGRKNRRVFVSIVDDDMFEYLSQWAWSVLKGRHTYYAYRSERQLGARKMIYMHRLIMRTSPNMKTDHVDGNGLNNQRSNLRLCTNSQNGRNRGKQCNNKSGHLGVCWDSHRNRWMVTVCGEFYGRYDDFGEACQTSDDINLKIKGEFSPITTI